MKLKKEAKMATVTFVAFTLLVVGVFAAIEWQKRFVGTWAARGFTVYSDEYSAVWVGGGDELLAPGVADSIAKTFYIENTGDKEITVRVTELSTPVNCVANWGGLDQITLSAKQRGQLTLTLSRGDYPEGSNFSYDFKFTA